MRRANEQDAFFIYRGTDSRKMGLRITNDVSFPVPERDIASVDIPGRDGSLAVDQGRWKDIEWSFPCHFRPQEGRTLDGQAKAVAAWLRPDLGYSRLMFSGEPGYYFRALCYAPLSVKEILRTFGAAQITFKCQPGRYAVSGDIWQRISEKVVLHNGHSMSAFPLIRVEGNTQAAITMSGVKVTIKAGSKPLVLDTETGLASEQSRVSGAVMPSLKVGNNEISVETSGDTAVYIAPRWRDL